MHICVLMEALVVMSTNHYEDVVMYCSKTTLSVQVNSEFWRPGNPSVKTLKEFGISCQKLFFLCHKCLDADLKKKIVYQNLIQF